MRTPNSAAYFKNDKTGSIEKILTKHRIRYRKAKNNGAFFQLNFELFFCFGFIKTKTFSTRLTLVSFLNA